MPNSYKGLIMNVSRNYRILITPLMDKDKSEEFIRIVENDLDLLINEVFSDGFNQGRMSLKK